MQSKDSPAEDLKQTLSELRAMRDEIRVQLHLAGMDAKDTWNRELEPRLFTIEKRIESELSGATKTALQELRHAMHSFRETLKKS